MPWKKSRLSTQETTLAVYVRAEPINPKIPVIWPENTENELFLTTGPMERFWTLRTLRPAGPPRAGRALPKDCGRPSIG